MTQPAVEQLLNLANRAERGPLSADEAARLRDGITAMAAQLHDAEGDRDSWARDARAEDRKHDTTRAELHAAQIALQKQEARAEQAEAKLTALKAHLRYVLDYDDPGHAHIVPGQWDDTGSPCSHCARLATARAALDPQEPQP